MTDKIRKIYKIFDFIIWSSIKSIFLSKWKAKRTNFWCGICFIIFASFTFPELGQFIVTKTNSTIAYIVGSLLVFTPIISIFLLLPNLLMNRTYEGGFPPILTRFVIAYIYVFIAIMILLKSPTTSIPEYIIYFVNIMGVICICYIVVFLGFEEKNKLFK